MFLAQPWNQSLLALVFDSTLPYEQSGEGYCFIDVGRRRETPEPETEDLAIGRRK